MGALKLHGFLPILLLLVGSSLAELSEEEVLDSMRNMQVPSLEAVDFYAHKFDKSYHNRFLHKRSPRAIKFADDDSSPSTAKAGADALSASLGLGPSGLSASVSAASSDSNSNTKGFFSHLGGLGGLGGGGGGYYPPPPAVGGGYYPQPGFYPGGGSSSASAAAAASSSSQNYLGSLGGGPAYPVLTPGGIVGADAGAGGLGIGGYYPEVGTVGAGYYPGYQQGYYGGGNYGNGIVGAYPGYGYGQGYYPGGIGGYGNYYRPGGFVNTGGLYGGPGFYGPGLGYGFGGFRKGEEGNKDSNDVGGGQSEFTKGSSPSGVISKNQEPSGSRPSKPSSGISFQDN